MGPSVGFEGESRNCNLVHIAWNVHNFQMYNLSDTSVVLV